MAKKRKLLDYLLITGKGIIAGLPGLLLTAILYWLARTLNNVVIAGLLVIISFVATLILWGYFANKWWTWR